MEQLTAKRICIEKLEVEKGNAMEATRARLTEVVNVSKEDLRQQATLKSKL